MSTTSLPSFAQTFSSKSLASIPSPTMSLARLAPIVNRTHSSPSPRPRRSRHPSEDTPSTSSNTSRKRSREDTASLSRDDAHRTNDQSSHSVRIKEEQEQEMLDASPPPTVQANPDDGLPPPSASNPSPSKKRRVTVSGAPNPLNTDVRVPLDQSASTPISPVVMGFTIKRDNPTAIEQVKSMITVKQQQKALIEQRRGSVAGVTSTSTPPTANSVPNPPQDERNMTLSKPMATRSLRRSPNAASNSRRLANAASQGVISAQRPPSPSPIIVSSQPTIQSHPPPPPQVPIAHSLPPPPISFARRRAAQLGAGKKKPADILISPREVQTKEQFQPVIQSAPPVPHAGQASFYSGRFSMTIPRLPSVLSGTDNIRRVASNVPPTPTRLAMQRTATGPSQTPRHMSDIAGRSPPAASVPIASSLVPPTPSALQHPGYSGDKAAFLAPFEVFYDALNDSKQLKNWLGEQLQKSNTLMQTLTQQQEKLNEAVEALVEKKTAGMRMEMTALQRRVEELEDALRVATSARRPSIDTTGSIKSKGKSTFRNGLGAAPVDSDGYTFPPTPTSYESSRLRPEPINRSSPGWAQQDKDSARDSHHRDSDGGTPTPYDAARHSSRMDASRTQASEQQPRSSYVPAHSPSHGLRQHQHQHQQGTDRDRERGGSSIRNASLNSGSQGGVSPPQEHQHPQRREDGRRNSVIMSPPSMSGDDG